MLKNKVPRGVHIFGTPISNEDQDPLNFVSMTGGQDPSELKRIIIIIAKDQKYK
jgi:hypothetical protein